MTDAMRRLAAGDKAVEIPTRDGKDEIAAMARTRYRPGPGAGGRQPP